MPPRQQSNQQQSSPLPNSRSELQKAASQKQLPHWNNLSMMEQKQLLAQILQMIAECRPLTKELLQPLPLPFLRALTQTIQQLQEEGMLGPKHRAPERLQRLRELLSQRLPSNKQPTENEVLSQQPLSMQRQVRAQEALGLRQAQSRAMVGMQQTLAATNNPAMSLVMGTEM